MTTEREPHESTFLPAETRAQLRNFGADDPGFTRVQLEPQGSTRIRFIVDASRFGFTGLNRAVLAATSTNDAR